MNEGATKAEARLFVLETLVSLLYAANHKLAIDPAASVAGLREKLITKAKAQTFRNLDPASSDLFSAEIEAAVDAALAMQETWLGLKPRQG